MKAELTSSDEEHDVIMEEGGEQSGESEDGGEEQGKDEDAYKEHKVEVEGPDGEARVIKIRKKKRRVATAGKKQRKQEEDVKSVMSTLH